MMRRSRRKLTILELSTSKIRVASAGMGAAVATTPYPRLGGMTSRPRTPLIHTFAHDKGRYRQTSRAIATSQTLKPHRMPLRFRIDH